MKTVKEIALDLDVSQVTVYNHINKLNDELKGNIFKKQGVTHLDSEGIKQLKISMGLIQIPTVKENISMEEIIQDISNNVTKEITRSFEKDFVDLQEKIETLEKQNQSLIKLMEDKQKEKLLDKIKGLFR